MIIAFIGTPGSGKTYEAVKNVLENLMKGRTVYTNIEGLDNEYCREFIKNYLNVGTFFLDTHLIFLTNEEAQEFWQHCKPKSYIAIDECHKLFSNRDWQTSKNRDFTFWASTHRHHGYDLLLITQDIVKVDSHVRSLVEWTYVYRKVNFLGSKVNRKYICFAYSGEDAQGPPLKKNIRTYNPDIFRCYKSYASADIKELSIMQNVNILKHPVFYAIPVALIFTLYMFFGKSSFATGDLFGAKKVLSKVENAGKEQPAETIEQQPESKPLIAETAANEESEKPADQESEEQEKRSHHIYRYLDRRTNTAHDTNNVETIPPGVPYWRLI